MRLLLVSGLTFLLIVAGVSRGMSRFGRAHYLPQQQMDKALAAGDSCFLFLGDSRMVAALEAGALHDGLRSAGGDRCHVNLALGAIDVGGIYVTAREYLSHGRLPRVAIVGKVGDSLLGPEVSLRPEELVGNNAIHLIWSEPGDVYTEVVGFPLGNIGDFDSGLRFLEARATALGRYQSLVTAKVVRLQARLVGASEGPQNHFGALGDMALLESGLRARAPLRLEKAMRGSEWERAGPWFRRLADLLRQARVPMVVVELPMRTRYRAAVTDTPQAADYQRWLAQELLRGGGSLLDLSRAPWVEDRLFIDELHLGKVGADRVSRELAKHLAVHFGPSSVEENH